MAPAKPWSYRVFLRSAAEPSFADEAATKSGNEPGFAGELSKKTWMAL